MNQKKIAKAKSYFKNVLTMKKNKKVLTMKRKERKKTVQEKEYRL